MNLLIQGYKFKLGSFACPEQWDVFDNEGTLVAYVRLRHGVVRAHCHDYGGDIVYTSETIGDGIFSSNEERLTHFKLIVEKIQLWIIEQKFKPVQYEE